MTDNQLINRINNIQRKYYGGDALRALEQPSVGIVKIIIISSLNFLVLFPTTKQIISKNSGVRESRPLREPFGERILTLH